MPLKGILDYYILFMILLKFVYVNFYFLVSNFSLGGICSYENNKYNSYLSISVLLLTFTEKVHSCVVSLKFLLCTGIYKLFFFFFYLFIWFYLICFIILFIYYLIRNARINTYSGELSFLFSFNFLFYLIYCFNNKLL
jgi:hypothetical protein